MTALTNTSNARDPSLFHGWRPRQHQASRSAIPGTHRPLTARCISGGGWGRLAMFARLPRGAVSHGKHVRRLPLFARLCPPACARGGGVPFRVFAAPALHDDQPAGGVPAARSSSVCPPSPTHVSSAALAAHQPRLTPPSTCLRPSGVSAARPVGRGTAPRHPPHAKRASTPRHRTRSVHQSRAVRAYRVHPSSFVDHLPARPRLGAGRYHPSRSFRPRPARLRLARRRASPNHTKGGEREVHLLAPLRINQGSGNTPILT